MKMGSGNHSDGGYEILIVNGGDGESLNVEHDDVLFCDGGVIEKVNDGDEIPNGNNSIYYARIDDLGFDESCDGGYGTEKEGVMVNYVHHLRGNDHVCGEDEGLVNENGFSLYSFLYQRQSCLLKNYWTELDAFYVLYGHVLTFSICFSMIQFYC